MDLTTEELKALEPGADSIQAHSPDGDASAATWSIAVSLKRIADALEAGKGFETTGYVEAMPRGALGVPARPEGDGWALVWSRADEAQSLPTPEFKVLARFANGAKVDLDDLTDAEMTVCQRLYRKSFISHKGFGFATITEAGQEAFDAAQRARDERPQPAPAPLHSISLDETVILGRAAKRIKENGQGVLPMSQDEAPIMDGLRQRGFLTLDVIKPSGTAAYHITPYGMSAIGEDPALAEP